MFTDKVKNEILDYLRQGNFRSTASIAAGVSYGTFKEWMALGKVDPEGDFGRFRLEALKAEKQAETLCVNNVMTAGTTEWQASAWYLKHGMPKRKFAPINKLEHSGPGGKPIETKALRDLTDEQLDALNEMARRALGGTGEQTPETGPNPVGDGEESET
jgi:hypothetical protein